VDEQQLRHAFRAAIGARDTSRSARRAAEARERRALKTGAWGRWRHETFDLSGVPGRGGWSRRVSESYANDLYVVLVRHLATGVTHYAIRTLSSHEPPWRDLQRIKNELAGPERFAVQVCPPASRLIDEADMYHLWVMPAGFEPGYGLGDGDEPE
jgi:hypothetical protein